MAVVGVMVPFTLMAGTVKVPAVKVTPALTSYLLLELTPVELNTPTPCTVTKPVKVVVVVFFIIDECTVVGGSGGNSRPCRYYLLLKRPPAEIVRPVTAKEPSGNKSRLAPVHIVNPVELLSLQHL